MESGRHRVFNFAMDILNPKFLFEKLDVVLDSLKSVAESNVAIGFVLKIVAEGISRYHKKTHKKTLLQRSKLEGTTKDLTKVKTLLSNTDVFGKCTKEQSNTKWKL